MRNNFNNLELKIIYSLRKTIALELKQGSLTIRAPRGIPRKEINAFLEAKRSWIEKHLAKMQKHQESLPQMEPFTMEELQQLSKKALTIIPPKVQQYATIVGVDYGRITIRTQRTRWGSCSSRGNLNFNCLLLLFPEEVIDYVVVHELCHRKHMNHSADFYKEIERVLPEYRKYQRWLKENGSLALSRLP